MTSETADRLKEFEKIEEDLRVKLRDISTGQNDSAARSPRPQSVKTNEYVDRDCNVLDQIESCKNEGKKFKEVLTLYVEFHVFIMLRESYENLQRTEARMSNKQNLDQAEKWFKALIGESSGKSFLVGPVGERPLHVCSLSAYRFPDVDFRGHGNYVKDGIIAGMQRYVRTMGWSQVNIPYGKDYIALVGSYLQSLRIKSKADLIQQFGKDGWPRAKEMPAPPFWSILVKWYFKNNFHQVRLCPLPTVLKASMEMKNSTLLGLYEGETVVFPMIAAGDAESLAWVLKEEKKCMSDPSNSSAR